MARTPPARRYSRLVVGLVCAVVVLLVATAVAVAWPRADDPRAAERPASETGDSSEPAESTGANETAAPAADTDSGREVVHEFLAGINAGDAAGTKASLCPDSASQADIARAIAGGARVRPDPATETRQREFLAVDLAGTVNGAAVTGRVSAFREQSEWCIYTFFALG